jgi:hypothetical protein
VTGRAAAAALLVLCAAARAGAQVPADCYRVEEVATPRGIAPEVTAVTVGADGRLYAAFRRGYLYVADPAALDWKRFATGLQTPLGILPVTAREVVVVQLPELTRLVDTDGDGRADLYETLCDSWGMSGNYHEFLYGPLRDPHGNFFLSLGLASGNANPRPPTRGEMTARGRVAAEPKEGRVNKTGHYSPVPYRGFVVKISPDGALTPFASGFRQPNGLAWNAAGDLFATDNQGEWVGTSPLYHVVEGGFYGNPASLNWHPDFKGRDVVDVPVEELARRRRMPAVQFPQNDMAGSVAQPLLDTTAGKFGPYAGQFLVAEWTYPRILRADLEKVGGQYQGACFILVEENGLRAGNNRIALSPDGRSLYTAQTQRIWGSAEGLQKITWTGKVPMDILRMRLAAAGFELTFTKPVDPRTVADPSAYSLVHYYYLYHSQYGSPKTDVTPVKVVSASVSPDGLRVLLTVDKLVAGRVYELRTSGIRGAGGEALATRLAAYTLNQLKQK